MSLSRRLEDEYTQHPVLHGLLQLVPLGIGAGLDVAISMQLQKMRAERLDALFQELREGERELTPELVQSEDFLQAFFATTSAALRTKHREKIHWFGRLLIAAVGANPSLNLVNEHEEFLAILDDLSYREIGVLTTLAEFETKYPKDPGENELQRARRFWDDFGQTIAERFRIPEDEVRAVFTRLTRTGCYETFAGVSIGYESGQGMLTATYYRLATMIRLQGHSFTS